MENSKKKVILIIEDEKKIAGLLEDKLVKEEYDILIAKDGKKGLKMITDENPDLILLDLMLPEMSGEEILKNMNESGLIKKIPVVIITAKADDADAQNCLHVLGAKEYITKSNLSLDEIVGKIKKYI